MTSKGDQLLSLINEDFKVKGNGRWFTTEEHSSLVVDAEKAHWFWNSRGMHGDAYYWLKEIRGLSHSQIVDILKLNKDYFGVFTTVVHNQEETVVYPALVEIFHESGLNYREYWYKRGLTDHTIDTYQLGYDQEWYTIPFFLEGVFRNFQCRRDDPKRIQHYYKGLGRTPYNFDLLKYIDTVFIAEGPTGCLALLQQGIGAVSHDAGAENWDASWFKYFFRAQRIIVVYDNDNAGREGAKKVAQCLGTYRTKIYTFPGFADKYDVGDFFNEGHTKDEFFDRVNDESKYSFEV
jgi:twinkle protein